MVLPAQAALLHHFITCGKAKGRQGKAEGRTAVAARQNAEQNNGNTTSKDDLTIRAQLFTENVK